MTLGLVVCVALLSGCGARRVAPDTSKPPRPSTTIRWVIAGASDVGSLDPTGALDPASIAVRSLLYEGLVAMGRDNRIEPAAAGSWREFNHGLRYLFTLRRGIRFSNGAALTARDVVLSFRRALDSKSAGPGTAGFVSELAFSSGVPSVFSPRPHQVEFVLSSPSPAFLAKLTTALTFARTAIIDSNTVKRYGVVWTQHADGLGPYRVLKWTQGRSMTLGPNPYSSEARGLPRLAITFVPRPESAIGQFRSGKADLVTGLPPSTQIPQSAASYAIRTVQPNLDSVILNTSRPPFNNVDNRLLMGLAVDRRQLASALYGSGATPTASIVPPELLPRVQRERSGIPPRDRAGSQPRFGGRPVFVFQNTPLEVEKAHLLAKAWASKLRIQMTLRPLGFLSYVTALQTGRFDLATVSWGARFADASDYLDQLRSTSPLNFGRWSSGPYDALMRSSDDRGIDAIERRRALLAAADLAARRFPWIPLESPVSLSLFRKVPPGWTITPFGTIRIGR